MDELDKAYEAVEMLKALDLPISKEQLNNIERLEKEKGGGSRDDIRSYFYQKCFAYYTERIKDLRQAKIRGEVIVAKPVLLLALIDGIENDLIIDNKIQLTDRLEERYVTLMQQYKHNSHFDKPTDISNPYWHLQTDGFWHLRYTEDLQDGVTPSKRWLKDKVYYSYFDDDLWFLLQNREWRQKLREYIIIYKIRSTS